MHYRLAQGQKSDSAAHDGLILEVLNRVENIVLQSKKKVTSGRTWGGGGGGEVPPPLWIEAERLRFQIKCIVTEKKDNAHTLHRSTYMIHAREFLNCTITIT